MSEEQNKPSDATVEPTEATAETAAANAAETGSPEDRVAKLEAEVASLKDQLLRAMAETENTRRRAQRDREDASKFAVSSFAKELVSVADNLRRALDAVPAEGREQDEMLKGLAVGVEATERQLFAAFDRAGIKKLDPAGEPFDPNFHQVMFEIENTGKAAGTVVQVLQPGYTIHGRLLREAMVGVAKGGDAGGQHVDTKA
ncbi:nucleotide exchange factor GrpE [Azospirillum sp. CT11-132]|jgi:molecular chaperone GrpE|uniref:nucleotide exchange factor GrpE n=1 Tax=unclassified Azospirillum TaxID=2630922 RepID=UPI000D61BB03|nr:MULTISPECIES: nucleotide exchange factor GrpE [unclassified Azospirillum]MCM8734901.1 nucleotide exchange factor GrpE [Azospirillum sp. A1-3]PWC63538.1 molecular chaperone GrpE [Azospirillum sp. TSH7]PWC67905.1 molecular chaperone GrpE [Azospirillum sp. TSH20]PWC98587.1 molecular chaperone GrpE [Azospirillum sp. TSO5]QCG97478.1 nucleotide exchange factor GrpE [Azospirillum sp. TSA2s]